MTGWNEKMRIPQRNGTLPKPVAADLANLKSIQAVGRQMGFQLVRL